MKITHLPMLGILLVLAEAVPERWYVKSKIVGRSRWLPFTAAFTLAACLSMFAFRQAGFFRNESVFLDYAVLTNPESVAILSSRGTLRADRGDDRGAIADFDRAISGKIKKRHNLS